MYSYNIQYSLFVLFACLGATLALRCYECNYADDGNDVYTNFLFNYLDDCGDPFKKDNISTVECDTSCYKAVVEEDNKRCVSRGCFPTNGCDETDANEQYLLECFGNAYLPDLHCCTGSTCNSGEGLSGTPLVVAVGAALVAWVRQWVV